MSRKIIAVAAVIILAAVGIVGGTLAWFTDEETAINSVSTGKIDISVFASGTEVEEGRYAGFTFTNLMPNGTQSAPLKIKNNERTAWLRAKIVVTWSDEGLNPDTKITLDVGSNWTKNDADGWYYYPDAVEKDAEITLFENVKLDSSADSNYAGKTVTIKVYVQAVQFENNTTPDAGSWPEDPTIPEPAV
ncbi:MAG: TasA family protein [Christensenellales bacterium]|jgi:predicted ribosomally synthesized peptide with SipW-like signal peptide